MLKSKKLNFAEIYRTRVKEKLELQGSLLGLCEVGDRQDLTIFVENIQSGKAVVVLGCLTAIYRIDQELAILHSFILLEFPSNIVRKKASEIISKHPQDIVLIQLRGKYSAGDPLTRKVVLRVYKRIGGWKVVASIIDSLIDDHQGVSDLAWEILGKWRIQATRLFTAASTEDIDKAIKALQKIDTKVISDSRKVLLRDVAFFLR
jgi:HEAT repeat protein